MNLKDLLIVIIIRLFLFSCSSFPYKSAPEKDALAPLSSKNQTVDLTKQHPDLTKIIYTQAIEKYIEAVYQKNQTKIDTLFIINRKNGQADDFPDINLPTSLKQTKLFLLSQEESNNQKYLFKKTSPCVNIIGWIEEQKAEFVFVTFFPEFKHQYDCHLLYKYNSSKKDYIFEQFNFK